MIRLRSAALLLATVLLAACDMAPNYVRSVSDFVPPQWPQGAAYASAQANPAGMPWRTLVTDPKLRSVIEQALADNQDLAAAVATVASARAQYRIQRSYQSPTLTADAGATIVRTISGASQSTTSFSGSAGVSAFEVDLFGRLKNLSREALELYLATESGARVTRLSIVAETATAYTTLASDMDLLAVAREQVSSSERTVRLTKDLHDQGLTAGSDLADAQTLLAQARSDVEGYTTQVARDRNALELLVGQSVSDALLPTSLDALDAGVGKVPAGLSSAVLLDRPDVVEAEHQLKAAYKDIGAAKAAFFPTVSLTSALGVISGGLTSLFTSGSTAWSVTPALSLPVFGGTNRGNLAYSEAQRDYYLATYRKTAQTAYREVADGLARAGTIDRQRLAQADLVTAAAKSYAIAEARYREGTDSFLTALVSQRTLYAARQTATSIELADVANRITLYQAIGSDNSI